MACESGFDGDFEGEAGGVVKEERVLGRCATRGGEIRVGLYGAEVAVDRLPEKEENHAEQRWDEAVEEVGRREALGRGQCWEERKKSVFDRLIDEADHDKGKCKHGCDHGPRDHKRISEKPRHPSVSHVRGVDVGL